MFTAIIVGLMYLVNLISIISIIFFRRKDMSVTFAWLLVFIFLPLVGFLLYFFFGSTQKLEIMSKKYRLDKLEQRYDDTLKDAFENVKDDKVGFADPRLNKYKDMILINIKNGKSIITEDNNVELLINGEEKFSRLFEEIKSAKESINVLYFIIKSKDEVGKQLIKLLSEKAAEGVEVRLLYDSMGCLKTKLRDFDPIVKNGGHVEKFLPSMLKTLVEVNYRLHRKMVIIDGKICYTGGINVGDDYLGKYEHISPWRDTSVRITGTSVKVMQLLFFKDWVFCEKQDKKVEKPMHLNDLREIEAKYFPEPEDTGNMGVQIIECGPDSKYATHKDSYVKMCTDAKKYLYIQSPYFVPDQTLLDAIRMSAQSGVDVRIMLPGIPDKKFVYNVAMSYVEELLEAGVRVYAHKGFIHAKTMVIDDFVASIGTTNLDIRSFKLDYEVNTLVYNEEFAIKCRDIFIKDIEDSTEFDLEVFKKRGIWRYIMESLCRFVAPLS
ncbi:MAG: cardiolipin synthase [Aminipila sp.]